MRKFTSPLLTILLFCLASAVAYAAPDCSSAGFVTATNFPAGNQPASVVTRDLNGDGRLDMAVANRNSGDVSVLLADGAGGFGPPTNYPVGHQPTSIAAGDFNGDGQIDLVTANSDSAGSISILPGAGGGAFGPARSISAAVNPYGIAAGDFNGDGRDDLAVGGTTTGVLIMLGESGGGLSVAATLPTAASVYHVVLAKFNGDDRIDLAAGTNDGTSSIFLGDGAGGFSPAATLPAAGFSAMAAGDFNGDGKVDLAGGVPYNGVAILLGDGAGNFAAAANYAGPKTWYNAMSSGDFNGDGKLDVAVLDGTGVGVSVYAGDGAGGVGKATIYDVDGWNGNLVTADLNGDGRSDLAAASGQGGVVSVLYGQAGGLLSGALRTRAGLRPYYSAVADFNGDGNLDLAVSNTGSDAGTPGASSISVLLGDGTGKMTAAPSIQFVQGLTLLHAVITADFNNDGKPDIAVAYSGEYADGVYTLLGKGDGTFAAPVNTALRGYSASVPYFIRSADFDHDGKADIAVSFQNSGNFHVLLGNGNGSFYDWTITNWGLFGSNFFTEFAAADLDGDGNPDLAFLLYYDKKIAIYPGAGVSGFKARRDLTLTRSPLAVAVGDFDRDGRPDLAVTTADGLNYYVNIFKSDGAGGFVSSGDYHVGHYPQSITTGDFNGDGITDLAVADSQDNEVSILTGDGAGAFAPSIPFYVTSYPTSVVSADFDRDGKIDLAVTQGQGQSVSILRNNFAASVPCLSVNDVTVAEGDAGTTDAVFNVTLSRASSQPVSVNYYVSPDYYYNLQDSVWVSPAPGLDYKQVSGTLVFEPGETSKPVGVPVVGDTLDEYDEKFMLHLSGPHGAAIHDSYGAGTITDDDAPPTVSITGGQCDEGNSTYSLNAVPFRVALSSPSAKPAAVKYQTRNGTAGSNDYQSASGTLSFAPGETAKMLNVACTGDLTYEPDEDFFVDLSGATNVTVAAGSGRGVIVNDDPLPKISGSYAYLNEGDAGAHNMTFTLLLSNPSYQTITVNYATADGTATAGSDYTATSGVVTFNPGETSKTFTVPVLGDTIDEVDETFVVNLTDPTNAALASAQAVGTIWDDDGPSISVNDISVKEGGPGYSLATFTVVLSAVSPQAVSVRYATAPGTATANVDYQSVSNRVVTVPPGQLTATFGVSVYGDYQIEPDETFFVNLSNPGGGTIARAQGVCTILNDDAPGALQFSASNFSVDESAGNAVVTVSRAGGATGEVSVAYATGGGTAQPGVDYTPTSGTLTFAEGETTKTFNVAITNDAISEGDETVGLTLSSPTGGAALGSPSSATLTVVDDDKAAAATIIQFPAATAAANESDLRANIVVTRTGDTSGASTVDVRTLDDARAIRCDDTRSAPGVAFARCDYATTVQTLVFAPGETSKTFSVPIIDDSFVEPDESVRLSLSNPSNATVGAQGTTLLVIHDNDAAGEANPIFSTDFFVRQQYLDFLSRDPEPGQPWSGVINNCAPNDITCDRVSVSANFFRSQEFQLKGLFVFKFYKVSFGRLPLYSEIVADMSSVTGASDADLVAKKAAFTSTWAQRAEFTSAFGAMTNQQFVDALMNRYNLQQITTINPSSPDDAQAARVTLTRAGLVGGLDAATMTRGQVVRAMADSNEVSAAEFNSAFVAMQYFGYLRRDPDAGGYSDWLKTINANPSDIRSMVNGFMNSTEYRLRFGQP